MDQATTSGLDVRLGGLAAALPPAERALLAAVLGLPLPMADVRRQRSEGWRTPGASAF